MHLQQVSSQSIIQRQGVFSHGLGGLRRQIAESDSELTKRRLVYSISPRAVGGHKLKPLSAKYALTSDPGVSGDDNRGILDAGRELVRFGRGVVCDDVVEVKLRTRCKAIV